MIVVSMLLILATVPSLSAFLLCIIFSTTFSGVVSESIDIREILFLDGEA